MLDKTKSVTTDTTASSLSHLAFCALTALGLAREDGITGTQLGENLFLIRWLASAQKQKRFPKSIANNIQWLLDRGRKHGPAGKLRQHLEYLWRSGSDNLAEQSDLYRLTCASGILKNQGWDNYVLDAKEWKSGALPTLSQLNGFYFEKAALNVGFSQDGRHLYPVQIRIIGDADRFMHVMAEYGLCTRRLGRTSAFHNIALEPA